MYIIFLQTATPAEASWFSTFLDFIDKLPLTELLVEVLNKLEKVKTEYFYFDNDKIFEKPNCLYILAQKIESIDSAIETEELKFYKDEYLEAKQINVVSKLKDKREQYIIELKKNQDRDIYKEFIHIQSYSNHIRNYFKVRETSIQNSKMV